MVGEGGEESVGTEARGEGFGGEGTDAAAEVFGVGGSGDGVPGYEQWGFGDRAASLTGTAGV